MSVPKALAVKNADGSFIVRVFYLPERYTEVLFPHDSQSEQLALEYAEFKNSQRVTGPDSPATQAVLTEYRAMQSNDIHEQLMEKAALAEIPSQIQIVSTPPASGVTPTLVGLDLAHKVEAVLEVPQRFPTDVASSAPTQQLEETLVSEPSTAQILSPEPPPEVDEKAGA